MRIKTSKRVRLKSNKCIAYWMNDDEWLVIGQRATHRVTVFDHRNIKKYICDCPNQHAATNGICSHALAVWKAM